jgi:subtilisin family serine protease
MNRFPSRVRHYSDRYVTLNAERLLLAFQHDMDRNEAERFAQRHGLALETGYPEGNIYVVNHTVRRFWVRSLTVVTEDLLDRIVAREEIDWIAGVYHRPDLERLIGLRSYLALLPNVLVVEFRSGTSGEEVQEIGRRYNLTLIEHKTRYLGGLNYYELSRSAANERSRDVYSLRDQILEQERNLVRSVHFESMPMISPFSVVPNDPIYNDFGPSGRWNLEIIDAPNGWDLSTGSSNVVIGVLDTGCDMSHPDLVYDGPGFNAGTGDPNGTPTGPAGNLQHGTKVAGIAAATINNDEGLAGVAGGCRVHAVVIPNGTEVEVAAALNETANVAQAQVINMSFSDATWDPGIIDPEIDNAYDSRDVVLCASSDNGDVGWVGYPASHPKVIAVGASDQNDLRVSVANWGSQWGPELDVVAPGIQCWTTDLQGNLGDTELDYFGSFQGTSCACPHVAGLAGLIRSLYPSLTNVEVRRVIETTCEKISPAVYTYQLDPGKPNGPWNEEVGYGRINLLRALDQADVYIRDNPSDDGSVPSTGPFWNNSDVLVRQNDDGVFNHQPAIQGQTAFVYIRVVNAGPAEAREVSVSVRATPFVGTEFIYPLDWSLENETHVMPQVITNTFPTLNVGGEVIARFSFSAAQIDQLYGWQNEGWHPCLLAAVTSANDGFASTGIRTWTSNNAAQRNISVVAARSGSRVTFPFVAGHRLNREPYMELVIDRRDLPRDAELLLDFRPTERFFPLLDLDPESDRDESALEFLEKTRMTVSLCGCRGTLTLAAGSKFECDKRKGRVSILTGAELVTREGHQFVRVIGNQAVIGVEKGSGEIRPMALRLRAPTGGEGTEYVVHMSQRNVGRVTVGGCSLVVMVMD